MMKEDATKNELNSSSLAEGDVVVVSENGNGEDGKSERRGSGSSAVCKVCACQTSYACRIDIML
jgi:hypothetical protein